MTKYWKIYKTFLENAISYQAQYRANMWMQIVLNCLWIGMMFVFIETFFGHTNSIGGWQKHEVYLMSIFWILVVQLSSLLFSGILKIPVDITEGNIDLFLVKPASPLFLLSSRNIQIDSSYYILFEIPIAVWLFVQYDIALSWSHALLGFFLLVCGIIIQYSVFLILNTCGFYFERFDNVNDLWITMHEMGQYPLHILPKAFQVAFFSLAPIAFTAYVPVAAMTGRLSTPLILYTILFTILLLISALSFWNFSIQKYSSASS